MTPRPDGRWRCVAPQGRPVALAVALLATCWLAGCATQTFHIHSGEAGEAFGETQAFFIGGLGQQSIKNATEVCGGQDRVARVQARRSLGDVLVNILSVGLYAPAHATVHCLQSPD